jgi:hypothetical protein
VALLDSLGIYPDVQDFFAPYHHQLRFAYGSNFEHYSDRFHRVPTTENIWVAGTPDLATDIFIAGSAMDCIAFNRVSPHFAFISLGTTPSRIQLERLPKRRFHLLFSNDMLGAVCNLKVAALLRKQPLNIRLGNQVTFRNKNYELENLSISALEKVSGYRFGIRTHKPKNATTWILSLNQRRSSPLSKPAPG